MRWPTRSTILLVATVLADLFFAHYVGEGGLTERDFLLFRHKDQLLAARVGCRLATQHTATRWQGQAHQVLERSPSIHLRLHELTGQR